MVPCPLIKEAAGEVLQVYGPGPLLLVSEMVICPPIHVVMVPVGNTGGAMGAMGKEAEPVHPFTVCITVKVPDPLPLNVTDALELSGPYGETVPPAMLQERFTPDRLLVAEKVFN